jgi:DNA polymerase sigma
VHSTLTQLPASEKALYARQTIIKRVNTALRRTFGQGYFAKPFGSTVYGVSSSDSDLDLIIYVCLLSDSMMSSLITGIYRIARGLPE